MPLVSTMPISPAELLRDFLIQNTMPGVIPHVVVGPATKEQIGEGVVELVDAGMPKRERHPLVVWVRAQIRCIGPSLEQVDTMGRHVWEVANNRNRVIGRMFNPDNTVKATHLIHVLYVVAGPSHHWDSQITWESLQFAEMMVGTTAIAA